MRTILLALAVAMACCVGCDNKPKPADEGRKETTAPAKAKDVKGAVTETTNTQPAESK